jgi:hypothetical protein
VIRLIQVNEVDAVWPMIVDDLERGYRKYGASSGVVDLHRSCRIGADFLVVKTDGEGGIKGAAVLDVRTDGTLNLVAICGRDLTEWMPDLMNWEMLDVWRIKRFVAECRVGFYDLLKETMPGLKVLRHVLEWER